MGTRRLTLLRHGKAESADAYPEDYRAPAHAPRLPSRRRRWRRVMVNRNLVPDLILVSPAERAWATAEIIASDLRTRCQAGAVRARTVFGVARENLAVAGTPQRLVEPHHDLRAQSRIEPGREPLRTQAAAARLPTAGIATAVWYHAEWATLQPENGRCLRRGRSGGYGRALGMWLRR